MDTVISNKYTDTFNALDIEVSKRLTGEYEVDEIISTFKNFFFNKMFLDITAIKDYKDLSNIQKLSMSINMDKVILLLDKNDVISDSKDFLSKLVNMGIYNFTKEENNLMYLYNNPNAYRDVAYLQNIEEENKTETNSVSQSVPNKKIIGIKNITDSAGSTTLIYLLKKELKNYYSTMAIELDRRDLIYLKDKDTLSIKETELEETLSKYNQIDLFLIDLNKSKKEYLCTEVLYLIEPTTIKLNKLSIINPKVFGELKDKKVVLNKSLLDKDDISSFEVESNLKVYYNIPPVNDKKDNSTIILPLLEKLGYIKSVETESPKKNRLFDFFK